MLNFNSRQSKIVETPTAVSFLHCVSAKSCVHGCANSFSEQIVRVTSAGYSNNVIRLALTNSKSRVNLVP